MPTVEDRDHQNQISENEIGVRVAKRGEEHRKRAEFVSAKKAELGGLIIAEYWQSVRKIGYRRTIVVGSRFILSLENTKTRNNKVKIQFVARGFDESEQPFIVLDISVFYHPFLDYFSHMQPITVFAFSLMVLWKRTCRVNNEWRVAFLSEWSLRTKVFCNERKHNNISGKQLYELRDDGDYWRLP